MMTVVIQTGPDSSSLQDTSCSLSFQSDHLSSLLNENLKPADVTFDLMRWLLFTRQHIVKAVDITHS